MAVTVHALASGAVSLLSLASSALLALSALAIARLERALGSPHRASAGLALLAGAQLAGGLLPLAGPGWAYVLYLAGSSLYAAGALVAWPPGARRAAYALPALPVLYAVGGDAVAFLAGAHASLQARGLARLLLAGSSACYLARAVGMLLSPSSLGLALLVAGEALRAVLLSLLALLYAPRPLARG